MSINRVTKVVKGGKNLSFSALVVVGDGHGVVGFGVGKAKEVPSAIKKGIEAAKKNLIRVPLKGTTIPHQVIGPVRVGQRAAEAGAGRHGPDRGRRRARRGRVVRHPERADEVAGSANPHNVVRATFSGLMDLKDPAHGGAVPRQGRIRSGRGVGRWRRRQRQRAGGDEAPQDHAGPEPDRLQRDAGEDRPGHGAAQDPPHGGAAGHARDARHDSQGASPREVQE